MIVNIKDLLNQLFNNTSIPNGYSGTETVGVRLLAFREFGRLQTSNEPDQQRKMISLFFGGTIYALLQEELKYGYDTGALAIVRKTWEQVEPKDGKNDEGNLFNMYQIGNYVLTNLPLSLPDDLYTRRRVRGAKDPLVRFIPADPTGPLFIEIANDISQVKQLLQFCIKNNNGDLEAINFDYGVSLDASDTEEYSNSEESSNSEEYSKTVEYSKTEESSKTPQEDIRITS